MTNEKIALSAELGVYVGKLSGLDNGEFHITKDAWVNVNDAMVQSGEDNSVIFDPEFWAESEYIGGLDGVTWAHETMQESNPSGQAISEIMDLTWEEVQTEIAAIEKAIELVGAKYIKDEALERLALLKRVGQSSPMDDAAAPDYEPAEDNWEA